MIPANSTPVPNIIFDVYLKELNPAELKVLFVVIRKTIGWVNATNSNGRKQLDWISHSQLMKMSGLSRRSLSTAINGLVSKKLINVYASGMAKIDLPELRKGKTKLFYELAIVDSVGKSAGCSGKTEHNWAKVSLELGNKFRISGHRLPITKETLQKKPLQNY